MLHPLQALSRTGTAPVVRVPSGSGGLLVRACGTVIPLPFVAAPVIQTGL